MEKVLTTCNFRRGVGGEDCFKKYRETLEGLSLYDKCDGEGNCMDFLTYKAVIKLVENRKR